MGTKMGNKTFVNKLAFLVNINIHPENPLVRIPPLKLLTWVLTLEIKGDETPPA